jgi:hypothetical protein
MQVKEKVKYAPNIKPSKRKAWKRRKKQAPSFEA